MSYLSGVGSARLPGATHIARTVSDSDSSSDESSEAQGSEEDVSKLTMDADEDDVTVGDSNIDAIGNGSPANIEDNTSNPASEEDSSYPKRRATRKNAEEATKKSLIVANEKSNHAYSMTTFKNKLGVPSMEAFLSRPEFEVDVATEFPNKGTVDTTFYDNDNNPISRAKALAYKCHELHQILIEAYKTAMVEEASREAAATRVIDGHRYDLPDNMVPDTPQTRLARIDLQNIRDRASIQINAAHDNNIEPATELDQPELGSSNQPLISAAAQSLIYKVVDAQIRGNRLRTLHISDCGDHRFQIPVEHGQLRYRLKGELQDTLPLAEEVDRAAIATKLVTQEFPPQL